MLKRKTFTQEMIDRLQDHAIGESDAKLIIQKISHDPGFAEGTMSNRWSDYIDEYSENVVYILWLCVRDYTYYWLKQNEPNVWFLPLFMPTEEQREFLRSNGRPDLANMI